MSSVVASVLKAYFQTGNQPTESQYEDLIDSALNMSESISSFCIVSSSNTTFEISGSLKVSPASGSTNHGIGGYTQTSGSFHAYVTSSNLRGGVAGNLLSNATTILDETGVNPNYNAVWYGPIYVASTVKIATGATVKLRDITDV
jgi:hypothetical protein